MVNTYERMKPWVDAGVKMVENESSAMFVIADRLGMRAGSICVSIWSMIEGTEYYEGPPSEEAFPESFEPDFLSKRVKVCSQIASRAVEILRYMDIKNKKEGKSMIGVIASVAVKDGKETVTTQPNPRSQERSPVTPAADEFRNVPQNTGSTIKNRLQDGYDVIMDYGILKGTVELAKRAMKGTRTGRELVSVDDLGEKDRTNRSVDKLEAKINEQKKILSTPPKVKPKGVQKSEKK